MPCHKRGGTPMVKSLLLLVFVLSLALLSVTALGQVEEESTSMPPPVRKIPGITTDDPFPIGCVNCHINYVEMNLDTRFSTLMKQWSVAVEPNLVAHAQASSPSGITIKGKHPHVATALEDIPAGCFMCHSQGSTMAPPFSRMLHRVHLSGGEENQFLTLFQGECTYCHKLDLSTGQWSIPSGPEP
jgi:hypothetical protein